MALNLTDPNKINGEIEFDHVFRVTEDGRVVDGPSSIYAPESYDGDLMDAAHWAYWSGGRSGQYAYDGPIMHPSEYLGGGMARDLMSEPGIYALVVDEHTHSDDCECGHDFPEGELEEPNGWAVVVYTGEDPGTV